MPSESAKLEFTKHAVHAILERVIPIEWVERVVTKPMLREPDQEDPEVEGFLTHSRAG